MLVRGTTPTIRFTFSKIDVATIAVAYMTIEQKSIVIEKDLSEATVGEKYIEWKLTQEDTVRLNDKVVCRVQCRYKTSDMLAYASKIYEVKPYDILKDGVI